VKEVFPIVLLKEKEKNERKRKKDDVNDDE
jgi:hypothetical protein